VSEGGISADSILILSGGLDSVTLLHHLVKVLDRRPAILTFLYGQRHAREIACARYQATLLGCAPHVVLDVGLLQPLLARSALVSAAIPLPDSQTVHGDPQPATYVPNRNLIFLSLAAAWAETLGVTDIFYGAQRHDLYGYWDTTPDFLERLNQLLQLNRRAPIHIQAPFVHDSKADLLRRGLALGVDYGHTWSCYAGGERACGRCPTCAERLAAFAAVGAADPLPYGGSAAAQPTGRPSPQP
jgi:7-cyano-7-deazaguanine synthase